MKWPLIWRSTHDAVVAVMEAEERRQDEVIGHLEAHIRALDARISDLKQQVAGTVDEERLTDAMGEIQYLRAKNDELVESLVRIQRHKAGLYETPRPPRPQIEPMPKELVAYFEGFGNKRLAKEQRDAAFREHGRGTPWEDIMARVFAPGPGAEELAAEGVTG